MATLDNLGIVPKMLPIPECECGDGSVGLVRRVAGHWASPKVIAQQGTDSSLTGHV